MDTETLIIIAVIVSVGVLIAAAVIIYRLVHHTIEQQESWTPKPRPNPIANGSNNAAWPDQTVMGRRSNAARVPIPDSPNGIVWMGIDLERKLEAERKNLELGGYRARVVSLPETGGYCVSVSGALPTKERTAYLYLLCQESFPVTRPTVYAEVLSATRFDDYGQAETREVVLQSLFAIMTWDGQTSSLLDVAREAFAQLDESYRPTEQLSGFLNEYGDWIRPT